MGTVAGLWAVGGVGVHWVIDYFDVGFIFRTPGD